MEKARGYWREAGVEDRIETRIGPATESLAALADKGRIASYDAAFVDADKEGYDSYYEACLTLLRPGGLIVFDNVLWSGRVADPATQDADTMALRALNAKLAKDDRIDIALAPVADGLFLCVKR
jgi:predicted O-methyltransferase YrrM